MSVSMTHILTSVPVEQRSFRINDQEERTTKSANGKRRFRNTIQRTLYYVKVLYRRLCMCQCVILNCFQLADAVTGLAYNVYNANGIWDPNFSATGHQPMGYDQWSTLYKTYRVKKCTIKAECANNQSTVPCLFIIAPSETTALLANASEQPGAVSCFSITRYFWT